MRLAVCIVLTAAGLAGQAREPVIISPPPVPGGSEPRANAADYPAHSQAGKLAIGAEYTVHSFSGSGHTFVAEKYLVVEVALYPPPGVEVLVAESRFGLRVNGKKRPLEAQSAFFVAASLKYPDWEQSRSVEGWGGSGDTGVILGRPAPTERWPGDPRGRIPRPPPRAPKPEDRSGIEHTPEKTADQVAVEAALPEGPTRRPVSGFLYFPYSGKTKGIKTLELLYLGPEGETALKLMGR
jgi:hypothetical protein